MPPLASVGPILTALREETGETVSFAKLQRAEARYLDESRHTVRYSLVVGDARDRERKGPAELSAAECAGALSP